MDLITAWKMGAFGNAANGTFTGSTFTTTSSSVSFVVRAPSGTTLLIDWGNGDSDSISMTAARITIEKDYGSADIRIITFFGDGNTALNYLICDDNNLSSLDVSNNTALNYLSCGTNNLSSLDVSNNTALNHLICDSNNLSSLDVNNTALTILACGANNLSSLDVSNNTALNHLTCSYNNLSSLDVNGHLAVFVANGLINGMYLSNQSTSAPPTGQGITDVATLEGLGWTIVTD